MRHQLIAFTVATLSACVFVPRTTEVYDADCRIQSKQMKLEPVQIASLGQCAGSGCGALLVVAGATAAASAVVSGSIVVAGNVVYWLEKQGRCVREIDLLGAKRALVLSTPEQRASAEMIANLLGSKAAGVFDRAVMHVPIETAREARQMALLLGADALSPSAAARPQGIAKALGVSESNNTTVAQATWDLAKSNGAPTSLASIGLQASDLDKACDIAMQNQYANPRPLERVALKKLF